MMAPGAAKSRRGRYLRAAGTRLLLRGDRDPVRVSMKADAQVVVTCAFLSACGDFREKRRGGIAAPSHRLHRDCQSNLRFTVIAQVRGKPGE
jgi:hypothetical protein